MKQSLYNILFKIGNTNIMINSLFGSIDEVENRVFKAFLQNEAATSLSQELTDKLLSRNYLTNLSEEKEIEFAKKIINFKFNNHLKQFGGSYVIILSYNCNFRCPYCFERKTQNKGIRHIGKVMNYETIDHLCKFIEINPPKTNYITIYGGEPLISENKAVLQYLITKVSSKYRLKIISNGYQIDNYIDVLDENNTCFIQISCDGSRKHHNLTRKSTKGEDTFDIILNNINALIDKNIMVNLRVNCTNENISDLIELHRELQLYHFYTSNLFSISYSPIIDFSGKTEKNKIEMTNFINIINTFNDYSRNHNFITGAYLHHHLRNNFKKALINKHPVAIQPVACNSYVNTFVLDPYGKIYPCWDVTDDPEHCIGTYYPQITENKSALLNWRNRELIVFQKCIRCPYVFYCGSGCAVKANLKTGKFDNINCDSFPYIFQTHFAHAYNNYKNSTQTITPPC